MEALKREKIILSNHEFAIAIGWKDARLSRRMDRNALPLKEFFSFCHEKGIDIGSLLDNNRAITHTDTAPCLSDEYFSIPRLENGSNGGNGNGNRANLRVAVLRCWFEAEFGHHTDGLRFIQIHGDALEPEYKSGDIVIFDTLTNDHLLCSGWYVLKYPKGYALKKIRHLPEGGYVAYSQHDTAETRIGESDQVAVLGRVVMVTHRK